MGEPIVIVSERRGFDDLSARGRHPPRADETSAVDSLGFDGVGPRCEDVLVPEGFPGAKSSPDEFDEGPVPFKYRIKTCRDRQGAKFACQQMREVGRLWSRWRRECPSQPTST